LDSRSDSLLVAPARTDDVPALLAIDVALTGRDRQEEIVRDSVAYGGCFVARDDSLLAGYITWDLGFFHRPFVRLLVVVAAYRRCGFGSALLGAVERAAATHRELFVSTETINAPMQALLVRAGYAHSGSIDNINAPGNAELVFHKRLV